MRKIFPKIIEKLMKKNKRIFCLLGDIGVFSFNNVFKNYKNRILNMSTMEQSMIGFAAGLAKTGYIPVIHSISPFLILRALEQIKIDFVYNKLNCNLVTVGASNDYAQLGVTHHCYEDISVLSNYKKINIFIPSNPEEFSYLFEANYKNGCVNYFRLSDQNNKNVIKNNSFIKLTNQNKLIICVGNSINPSVFINKKIDIYYINSIKTDLNINFVKKYKKIIIIEPFFGNILERIIREKKFLNKEIFTISYKETIIHKYGNKKQQDTYLKFNEEEIIKKVNDFTKI